MAWRPGSTSGPEAPAQKARAFTVHVNAVSPDQQQHDRALAFPFETGPGPAEVIELAGGILWARVPLPFKLDHVNIYLIPDHGGWAVVDTGIADQTSRDCWSALLEGPLRGERITKVIVTHSHPDHIGLAGWLCERFDAPLYTGEITYLRTSKERLSPGDWEIEAFRNFYATNGASEETIQSLTMLGHAYLRMVDPLPPKFVRMIGGESINIGGRVFEVLVGEGHASEQLMFYWHDGKILLSADQVIEEITPNVSVWASEPDGDPLHRFLNTLETVLAPIPDDVLVLPGHRRPFVGLQHRCECLRMHHVERCQRVVRGLRAGADTVADLVPYLFRAGLSPHEFGFAFGETLAHVNYIIGLGEILWDDQRSGVRKIRLKAS